MSMRARKQTSAQPLLAVTRRTVAARLPATLVKMRIVGNAHQAPVAIYQPVNINPHPGCAILTQSIDATEPVAVQTPNSELLRNTAAVPPRNATVLRSAHGRLSKTVILMRSAIPILILSQSAPHAISVVMKQQVNVGRTAIRKKTPAVNPTEPTSPGTMNPPDSAGRNRSKAET